MVSVSRRVLKCCGEMSLLFWSYCNVPKFAYQAINESGKTLSGTIEADSVELVQNILVDRAYSCWRDRSKGITITWRRPFLD